MGTRFSTIPLGLATVAALTPADWDVELIDENVESINYETDADLIGITAFNVQYKRALEIAKKFREQGKKVVIGGPYCSLFPEAFEGKCDYRVSGEAEHIWPQFLKDFKQGKARELYISGPDKVDMNSSPTPRFDLLQGKLYNMFSIQTSRGCPFSCEFCDIIVMDGRVPRTKSVEQVIKEIDECVKQGAHYVVFADANFLASIPYTRKLLKALAEYQKAHDYPLELSCELSINVAHHPDLLELLQAANFYSLFIGIESPREQSLRESKKLQNTRKSMAEDIARIHSYHISVVGGMIVGFDSDDKNIFREHYDFLMELGIPFTTCGTLMALPKTPLLKRLEAEGRIFDFETTEIKGHGAADSNIIPKQMTSEELMQGYNWLIRSLYQYDSYRERLVRCLNRFQNRNKEHKRAQLDLKFLGIVFKILGYYLFTLDPRRRRFFIKSFQQVAQGSPFSVGKWLEYFRWTATHRAFHDYVTQTHGCPEAVDSNANPFPEASPQSTNHEVCNEALVV